MKKNFQTVFILAVLAVLGGVNVYNSQSETDMSDIALANVEALADDDEYFESKWNIYHYTLDNGTPAHNCWSGGSTNCL